MSEPCIVLIAAPDRQKAVRDQIDADGTVLVFSDDEPLEALAVITRRKPRVVALERLFAASPRGAALIARVKADPALKETEIRIIAHDGSYARVSPRRRTPIAAPPPAGPLDRKGTRRAPRFRMKRGVDALVDGNPVTLVDVSVLGAQLVSPASLRPNQRVKVMLSDDEVSTTMSATIVWARFEPARQSPGPTYRCGVEFINADPDLVEDYCARHQA